MPHSGSQQDRSRLQKAETMVQDVIRKHKLPPLSDEKAWEAQWAKASDHYIAQLEKEYDTSILEVVGFHLKLTRDFHPILTRVMGAQYT